MHVDFTLPFTESGVSMVVPVKENKNKSAWIFLKPLAPDLWLGSFAFFFFTGFVVWVMEHRINTDFRGPPTQQISTTLFFAFSTLFFAHRERVMGHVTKFTLIVWLFVVQILTSSYIASLTTMLTVQQLQPAVTDVSELIRNGDYVGYQDGSFVGGMLTGQLKFDKSKIRKYNTSEEFAETMSLGSSNGGVTAIFDEIQFLKIFLSHHCADYTMVGEVYKTSGYGFVFPKGSPLVPDVSRAILKVTEEETMARIEKKWFGDKITCPNDANNLVSSSLNFRSFAGLFLVTGTVSLLSLIYFMICFIYKKWDALKCITSQSSLWRMIIGWGHYYVHKEIDTPSFKNYVDEGSNHSDLTGFELASTNIGERSEIPISIISWTSDMNEGSLDSEMSFTGLDEPVMGGQPAEAAREITEIRDCY